MATNIPEWLFFIDITNYQTISYALKQEIIKIIPTETIIYENSHRQFDNDLYFLCHNHIHKYERSDYDKYDIMKTYDFIYHLFFIDFNTKRRLDHKIRYWLNKNVNPTISFMFEAPSYKIVDWKPLEVP
jgi:galactose-1-phosphate uridylyltransferase